MALSWKERGREVRKFLNAFPHQQWGYVIYRTVYTAESDSVWDSVMAKLDAYVHKEVNRDLWLDAQGLLPSASEEPGEQEQQQQHQPLDPAPNARVMALYSNIVMDDRDKYDGATVDDVANHFVDWVDDAQNADRFRVQRQVCLLVDEEVLWWLMDADAQPRMEGNSDVYVKVVDGDYDPDESNDPKYPGWALSKIDVLWYLWRSVEACDMETVCSSAVDTGRGLLFTG